MRDFFTEDGVSRKAFKNKYCVFIILNKFMYDGLLNQPRIYMETPCPYI